ncbi:DUF234 domain-containing protein [Haloarcula sediminis]|uniref:DUF234 domain-containing protein n=1 Tax=Haloarcula sediminis TaxID=3111777 RepID=UPI002D798A13|nr:DUF234 domain-containing protein [Haloarcula sp. CK38]
MLDPEVVHGTGEQYDELGEEAFDVLIKQELADFVSRSFEDLCCSALRAFYPEQTTTETSQWWYDDHEIDVVGLTTDETLIAGECELPHPTARLTARA